MAGASLLMLLDDIATVLDDVAVLTKVAAKKTAGVLGDDLAVNAQQVSGVASERELPVVWAVAVGSLRNKAILVPAALLISYFLPWLIKPLLIVGGLFLAYEGFEKVVHWWQHRREQTGKATADVEAEQLARAEELMAQTPEQLQAMEKEKISGAIRTDFILSAEIIVISLGVVAGQSFWMQLGVLIGIALVMTVGVYGFVALIVKIDDAGLALYTHGKGLLKQLGQALLYIAPRLMKVLTVVGTVAMFLVGGGILHHNIDVLHHYAAVIDDALAGPLEFIVELLYDLGLGVIGGALVLAGVTAFQKLRGKPAAH